VLNDPKLVANLGFVPNGRLGAVKLGRWSLITLKPAETGVKLPRWTSLPTFNHLEPTFIR